MIKFFKMLYKELVLNNKELNYIEKKINEYRDAFNSIKLDRNDITMIMSSMHLANKEHHEQFIGRESATGVTMLHKNDKRFMIFISDYIISRDFKNKRNAFIYTITHELMHAIDYMFGITNNKIAKEVFAEVCTNFKLKWDLPKNVYDPKHYLKWAEIYNVRINTSDIHDILVKTSMFIKNCDNVLDIIKNIAIAAGTIYAIDTLDTEKRDYVCSTVIPVLFKPELNEFGKATMGFNIKEFEKLIDMLNKLDNNIDFSKFMFVIKEYIQSINCEDDYE